MRKRVGNASLGWLCLLVGGLWLAYKHEFVSLLLAAWGRPEAASFDHTVELRVLVFILSPGLILVLAGLAILLKSMFSRPRTPGGTLVTK
jgi:hypothetical protein